MLDAEFNSESNGTVFIGGYRAKNRILLETEMGESESKLGLESTRVTFC